MSRPSLPIVHTNPAFPKSVVSQPRQFPLLASLLAQKWLPVNRRRRRESLNNRADSLFERDSSHRMHRGHRSPHRCLPRYWHCRWLHWKEMNRGSRRVVGPLRGGRCDSWGALHGRAPFMAKAETLALRATRLAPGTGPRIFHEQETRQPEMGVPM